MENIFSFSNLYDDPVEVQFKRKIFTYQRSNSYTGGNVNRDSPAWQKVKHDYEFYEHLSEEMKKSYKEYLERTQQEYRQREDSVKESRKKSQHLYVLPSLMMIIALISIIDLFGQRLGMFEERDKPTKEK